MLESHGLDLVPARCPAELAIRQREADYNPNQHCPVEREDFAAENADLRQSLGQIAALIDCPHRKKVLPLSGTEVPKWSTVQGQSFAKKCPAYKFMKEQQI